MQLTPKEYELLQLLLQNAGKVLTHRFLINKLWKRPATVDDVRIIVRQLRGKIEADPKNPRLVLTEHWVGYWMLAPTPDNPARNLAEGGRQHFERKAGRLSVA